MRDNTDRYPPAVNLRPSADWPDRAVVAVDLARVAAIIDRIAADVDELARARRVQDLDTAAVLPTLGPNAAGGWPSRTWSSGPFAPGGGCPLRQPRNWSGPGTPGRPSDTSAARLTSGPATPTTRSGHANDHPRATSAVQETGRFSGADGSIVTGTPPGSARSSGGSPNCSAAAWTAACSAPSTSSPPRWRTGSRSGTPAPGPSGGPRPPTRSSTASAATAHASLDRDTSGGLTCTRGIRPGQYLNRRGADAGHSRSAGSQSRHAIKPRGSLNLSAGALFPPGHTLLRADPGILSASRSGCAYVPGAARA
jgi:hypothetical protein